MYCNRKMRELEDKRVAEMWLKDRNYLREASQVQPLKAKGPSQVSFFLTLNI